MLYSKGFDSFKVGYGEQYVPKVAGESVDHIDCICEILDAKVKLTDVKTSDIFNGLSRFRVSNWWQE